MFSTRELQAGTYHHHWEYYQIILDSQWTSQRPTQLSQLGIPVNQYCFVAPSHTFNQWIEWLCWISSCMGMRSKIWSEIAHRYIDTDCHQLPIKGVTLMITDLTTNRYQLNSNLPAFLFLPPDQKSTNILWMDEQTIKLLHSGSVITLSVISKHFPTNYASKCHISISADILKCPVRDFIPIRICQVLQIYTFYKSGSILTGLNRLKLMWSSKKFINDLNLVVE